ncbi:MAG TPA: SCO1664 family protein [Streptosporangiaceae bacterium]|nr:SCO1664 family protein [Streptosporangiaceae bacterium]
MPDSPTGKRTQRPARSSRPPRRPAAARPAGDGPASDGPASDGPAAEALDHEAAVDLLASGTLTVEGRLVEASNATLYCSISHQGRQAACVYKPVAGERPLWDFPPGTLAAREVAAYLVSRAAGWGVVPPTVMRDGRFGPGMCQLWIETDPTADLIALSRSGDHPQLRDMAVFDAVVNNADRKIGHLLPLPDGHLYGCDHGVCFGEEYKLRTVLWQWRGRRLPGRAMQALSRLQAKMAEGELAAELAALLSPAEVRATSDRIDLLIQHRVHPYPPENWPAVPWPPV